MAEEISLVRTILDRESVKTGTGKMRYWQLKNLKLGYLKECTCTLFYRAVPGSNPDRDTFKLKN